MTTASTPLANRNADLAALILRVTLGGLFITHALLKIVVFTLPGAAGFFQSLGLPGFLAYVVTFAELLGGAALVAGFQTRIVALVLIPVLLGAIFTVHLANGFFFSNPNGGWEYPAFWAIALVVQSLLGNGAYALGKSA